MSMSMPCRRSATACSVASSVSPPGDCASRAARTYLLSEQLASSHGQRDGSHSSSYRAVAMRGSYATGPRLHPGPRAPARPGSRGLAIGGSAVALRRRRRAGTAAGLLGATLHLGLDDDVGRLHHGGRGDAGLETELVGGLAAHQRHDAVVAAGQLDL